MFTLRGEGGGGAAPGEPLKRGKDSGRTEMEGGETSLFVFFMIKQRRRCDFPPRCSVI